MVFSKKIKRALISFVALISLVSCSTAFSLPVSADAANSYQADQVNLAVKSAIAIDSDSGQILYAKNADKTLPIASMTKLATVYLTLNAIKNKKISWNQKVKPTAPIVKVANNAEYSNVPLKMGHSYTIKQLYQATLIESANGAAILLGQTIAGSQKAFINQMRAQVKKWGIEDAKIYTACGLPNGNLGKDAYPGINKNAENTMSAKDMAIVGQNLIKDFPEVLDTTKLAHLDFKDQGKTTKMANFNWMLKGLSQYDQAYPVDGLKTGTTDAAGACFIGTIKHSGARLITVVMGARHQDGTDPSRFIQTKKLMNYIFTQYRPVTMNAGSQLNGAKSIKVTDGDNAATNLGLKNKTTIWDPADGKTLVASLNKKAVEAPIAKNQVIGDYQLKSGNEKIVSITNPNGMNVPAKALGANGKVNIFVRIWRWIFGGR
ncbi:serine hydrolase [Lactobacillus kefiranofaciens]|uniref:serine-type D-Ala-D-Ala carboxypeptidase n=1 Tax=Lactobacillus kefiranofaciens TaxID=267818 RepID=A0AAX3UGI6_9LACO|nr:serine hydrolase [Lactobacillus kefiranofaciens]AEG39887.1 D-alanyl-d-alanine carboxypeptidase [Lactobacillus kefiranofaciens subsp. kefiranofaciens]KRM21911.1 D-alanyl-d-alanine carboxypeptidase [Lactobacillus kefiranofaciens subsp. kefiranofaciens DSM 5016 = JCM 6985]QFQ67495.1 D-alanyl-D-alanine carboxypeptidase [Lactobacillus kefiranofaciens subsp. kefiranofaciens]WGO86761.1 serine hydrolase [Lactobacillus kefiranofaciens]WQH35921.1 serine hydrolase [Lactobacillus kefiranofaciens]